MNLPNSSFITQAALDAEERVIRQLFEALLFEQMIDFKLDQGTFRFSLADKQYQATGYRAGFNRIRLNPYSIENNDGAKPDLDDIIASLSTPKAIQEKLKEQLTQTIKLCEWNDLNLHKPCSRFGLSYQDLESQLDEGHPYHPCFKARTGFTLEDHQNYGPECAMPFQLHWLAVKREIIDQSFPIEQEDITDSKIIQDLDFWQHEIGLEGWLCLQKQMQAETLNWDEYTLLPVHPWQWQNLKDNLLLAGIKARDLVYLGAAGDLYQASISVRTLLNISYPHKANIKLPMNMINTSSLRVLNPHSVCTAPEISKWLIDVNQSDSFLNNKLILLNEYAGFLIPEVDDKTAMSCDTKSGSQPWQNLLRGQLGVIFRESVSPYLQSDQDALPFSALYAVEEGGEPFIKPLIQQYGLETWLTQLIDVAVIPVWHLLVKHGLAVEAHGQNMVLVHKHGWPQQLVLRDFHESVEYVEDYLAQPELKPNFDELNPCYRDAPDNEYFWMDSVEALRELIVDTLFVFNLSELACLCERHFDFSENHFWDLVYQRLQNHAQQGHCSQQRLDRMPINQAQIQTESLIKKKLADIEEDLFHHQINNPFAHQPPLKVEE